VVLPDTNGTVPITNKTIDMRRVSKSNSTNNIAHVDIAYFVCGELTIIRVVYRELYHDRVLTLWQ